MSRYQCPYPQCGFTGTDEEVDDHRTYAHSTEPQAGSNIPISTHTKKVTIRKKLS